MITSLGFSTIENAFNMMSGKTGIRLIENPDLSPTPFYASMVDTNRLNDLFSEIGDVKKYTRLEKLALLSVKYALAESHVDPADSRTLLILSTTKGNIDLLEKNEPQKNIRQKLFLWDTAKLIADFFSFRNVPVVVSNACISGTQAIILGARLISAGLYNAVVINGTDIISEFVVSGFNSFKSLSNGPCRPFDKTRDGLSLGEGSGTIILSNMSSITGTGRAILAGSGFSSNDANHISGPSRTGEGLYQTIDRLLKNISIPVDFISAHGTGTIYNDEMESIALTRAGLQEVPVNSFKGYWGHTLGAAGIIESIMSVYSMKENILFKTAGYTGPGLKHPINVIDKLIRRDVNSCIKIASGFGGCNAALMFYAV